MGDVLKSLEHSGDDSPLVSLRDRCCRQRQEHPIPPYAYKTGTNTYQSGCTPTIYMVAGPQGGPADDPALGQHALQHTTDGNDLPPEAAGPRLCAERYVSTAALR